MKLEQGVEVRLISKDKTEETFGYAHGRMLEVGETDYVLWVDGKKVAIRSKCVGLAFSYHIEDLELVI